MTKPFDLEVLLARISASLRRASTGGPPSALERSDGSLQIGGLMIDTDTRSLRTPSGEVPLTPKEHGLLQLLLAQPGHLFSREEITESVWHHRYIASSRTLDVHMRRVGTSSARCRRSSPSRPCVGWATGWPSRGP